MKLLKKFSLFIVVCLLINLIPFKINGAQSALTNNEKKYVYLDMSGNDIFTVGISVINKESEITYSDGTISYERSASTTKDAYVVINMVDSINFAEKYVTEFDFKVSNLSGSFTFPREYIGSDYENGVLCVNSKMEIYLNHKINGTTKFGTISKNTEYNMKIVADKALHKKTIYLNGNVIGSYDYEEFEGTTYRTGLSSGGNKSSLYIKNLRVYDYSNNFDTTGYETLRYSLMETDKKAQTLIGKAVVFSDFDTLYYNGVKSKLSDMGYTAFSENEVLYVPIYPVAKVYGLSYNISGESATLGGYTLKNGLQSITGSSVVLQNKPLYKTDKLYIPVYEVMTKLFGKYGYSDERGFVMLSDSEISLSNSVSSFEIKEPVDTVYRYLKFDRPTGAEILSDIIAERPRVITNRENLAEVKRLCAEDEGTKRWYRDVINDAEKALESALVEYSISDGVRLLNSARSVLNVVTKLSVAYLLTGEEKYAARCWEQMENALLWEGWNASKHYLDCSELSYAMAIGFDSIYDTLTKEQRNLCIKKTMEYSLLNSVGAYQGTFKIGSEWRFATGNWGAVCPGGMIAACVSFAGEEYENLYEVSSFLLGEAIQSLEYPLMLFYPDGAWSEGLGYWSYTAQYLFGAGVGSLYHSTGKTYSLLDVPGISETLDSVMYLQSSEGAFNFADAGTSRVYSPQGYLLSYILGDKARHKAWHEMRESITGTGEALALLWHRPTNEKAGTLPNDKYFYSAEAGTMKHSWDEDYGMYIGIKGGQNHTNHDNLDLGNFIFDALGERWAIELGSDDYNIEGGYWGLSGYQLYKKRPEGQNCIVINPREDVEGEYYGGQYLDAYAPLTQFVSKEKGAYMVLDLSDAYKFDVSEYKRGFYFGNDRTQLTVQDEINLLENNSTMLWFMHTRADIDISGDGKSAILMQNGKRVLCELISNADTYSFEKRDTERLETSPVREGENSRAGIYKLTVNAKGSGKIYIAVRFTPVDGEEMPAALAYTPISDWTVPDGRLLKPLTILNVDNEMVYDSGEDFNVVTKAYYDCENIKIYIDGEEYKKIENVSAGEHIFTIKKEDIVPGYREIYATAMYSDGVQDSSVTKKISFVDFKNTDLSTIDFENCSTSMTKNQIISAQSLKALSDQSGSAVSIISGYSGNDTKVLKMELTKAVSSSKPYIRGSFTSQKYSEVTTEFDIYFDNVFADVAYEPRSSNASYGLLDGVATTSIFTRSGKIGETEKIYTSGRWYNVICTMDMVNDIFTVSVDGEEVSRGSLEISDIAFWSINLGSTSSGGINYYLDNIVTTAKSPTVSVGDVSFIADGNTKNIDNSTHLVPVNLEKLIVKAVNGESITAGDFSLKLGSKSLDAETVIYGDEVHITPKEDIEENSELYICLYGVECKRLYTSKDGEIYVKAKAYQGYGMIDAITQGEKNIMYVVVSQDSEGNIIDLQLIRVKPEKGAYSKKLSVNATGAAFCKVYVVDKNMIPIAKSIYQY